MENMATFQNSSSSRAIIGRNLKLGGAADEALK